MMRSQQALAFRSPGYLAPEHYDQIFSARGTLMIFFVAVPFVIGLMNFVMPLQFGVRDVAFPTLISHTQLGRLLAYRHRCAAGQYLVGRWRIRAYRVAAVSPSL